MLHRDTFFGRIRGNLFFSPRTQQLHTLWVVNKYSTECEARAVFSHIRRARTDAAWMEALPGNQKFWVLLLPRILVPSPKGRLAEQEQRLQRLLGRNSLGRRWKVGGGGVEWGGKKHSTWRENGEHPSPQLCEGPTYLGNHPNASLAPSRFSFPVVNTLLPRELPLPGLLDKFRIKNLESNSHSSSRPAHRSAILNPNRNPATIRGGCEKERGNFCLLEAVPGGGGGGGERTGSDACEFRLAGPQRRVWEAVSSRLQDPEIRRSRGQSG